RSTTVSWKLCVAMSARSCTVTSIFWRPSRMSEPGPEKVTTDPATDPVVGAACTIMLCARPNAPRTKADRPAIKHSKLPDAEPDPSMETFIATCEIDAVPPPARWLALLAALAWPVPNSSSPTARTVERSLRLTAASASVPLLVDHRERGNAQSGRLKWTSRAPLHEDRARDFEVEAFLLTRVGEA